MAVQLADHDKFLPPMPIEAGKACPKGDQGINGFRILLQVVELPAFCGFDLATGWFLLFDDIKGNCTCLAAIVSGPVFAKVHVLVAQIINNSSGQLPCFVQQLQISRIGDVGWRARGIDGECSPVLVLWSICRLHEVFQ